jgi:mannose-6-phosphate isomerase
MMNSDCDKNYVFEKMRGKLFSQGFNIIAKDFDRPWGGFLVIDERQSDLFVETFFHKTQIEKINKSEKISPKILIVAPNKKLSWQYHFRRAELWMVLEGDVKIAKSFTDEEPIAQVFSAGEPITLGKEERHRLMGLNSWGIVAEIWHHLDTENPSDEMDIVRLQDDFER